MEEGIKAKSSFIWSSLPFRCKRMNAVRAKRVRCPTMRLKKKMAYWTETSITEMPRKTSRRRQQPQSTVAPPPPSTVATSSQPTVAPPSQRIVAPHSQPTVAPPSQPTVAPPLQPTVAPPSQPTVAPPRRGAARIYFCKFLLLSYRTFTRSPTAAPIAKMLISA